MRSFRLRVALLSVLLAGSALVGFGVISWLLIYQANVSRLDAELENQLMRASRPRPRDRWQSYTSSLPRTFTTHTETAIALLVIGADGNVEYRSEQWPADIDITNLWTSRPPLPNASLRPVPLTKRFSEANPPPSEPTQLHPAYPFSGSEPRPPEGPPPTPRFTTQRTASGTWRVSAATTPMTQVAIAVSLNAIDQQMDVIRNIFLVAIPGVLLVVAGGAWAIAGSSLHPIRRLTKAIGTVTASGLEKRVPIGSTDLEFVELIQVFNQMLERLERSFKQASRFSADAAHELKTPLAILQGELERTLQQVESGSELQQRLSHLLDEVRRLSGIVRKLLLLSLADTGQMSLHRVEVDLSGLLMEMTEDIELLAPHLEIQTEITPGLRVQGDRDLLVQVLQNLISNAIKYNLPNGWIRIAATHQERAVMMTISNSSEEIPASDRDRIFDRFYRADPARTRKVEGIGLGLSLAREIVRAHQGNLTLDSTSSGQTSFTLTLPVR